MLVQKPGNSVFEGLFFLKLGNLAVLSLTLAQSQKNREEHCAHMSDALKEECHTCIKLELRKWDHKYIILYRQMLLSRQLP